MLPTTLPTKLPIITYVLKKVNLYVPLNIKINYYIFSKPLIILLMKL